MFRCEYKADSIVGSQAPTQGICLHKWKCVLLDMSSFDSVRVMVKTLHVGNLRQVGKRYGRT